MHSKNPSEHKCSFEYTVTTAETFCNALSQNGQDRKLNDVGTYMYICT